MNIIFALFLSLSTTLSPPLELHEFKKMAINDPHQALQDYQLYILDSVEKPSTSLFVFHRYALKAALRTKNWAVLERIVEQVARPEFAEHLSHHKIKIISNIGVAYRKNGQMEQAIQHYLCALNYAQTEADKSLLKVNLAIAYRLSDRPAMAYQLIEGLDGSVLPSKVGAGLHVVLGNTLLSLSQAEEALKHFEYAQSLYLRMGDMQSHSELEFTMIGVYLVLKELVKFESAYHAAKINMQSLKLTRYQAYMNWIKASAGHLLDKIKTKQSDLTARHSELSFLALEAVRIGYRDLVNLQIKEWEIPIPLLPKIKHQYHSGELREQLGKPWCPDF